MIDDDPRCCRDAPKIKHDPLRFQPVWAMTPDRRNLRPDTGDPYAPDEHERHLLSDRHGLCVPGLDKRFGPRLRIVDDDLFCMWPKPEGPRRATVMFETGLTTSIVTSLIAHRRECSSTTCIEVWRIAAERERHYGDTDCYRLDTGVFDLDPRFGNGGARLADQCEQTWVGNGRWRWMAHCAFDSGLALFVPAMLLSQRGECASETCVAVYNHARALRARFPDGDVLRIEGIGSLDHPDYIHPNHRFETRADRQWLGVCFPCDSSSFRGLTLPTVDAHQWDLTPEPERDEEQRRRSTAYPF